MIALPAGVTVYTRAGVFTGEVPEEHCPEELKPPVKKGAATERKELEPA